MKAHLMYRDRDFDLEQELPSNHEALVQDLELNTLFNAMAGDDEFLLRVVRHAVLTGLRDDIETIHYRQAVLKDCLANGTIVCLMYDLAVEVIESKHRQWFGILSKYPGGVLSGAIELLQMLVAILGKLRLLGREHSHRFRSEGFVTFFKMIEAELPDDYFARIKMYLQDLKFPEGVPVSAELGECVEGIHYMLRRSLRPKPTFLQRIFAEGPPAYSFRIAERDEAGAQAISELRDRGLNLVANALAQSADHVMNFFALLRVELAFYVGCETLHRRLVRRGTPVCFPTPAEVGSRHHSCTRLSDACLTLTLNKDVIGSDMQADGKNLVMITGANQGGKSTFLRAVGLAQVMMQCGMFVTAASFSADLCRKVFTHYKREEDTTMESGKFDEELKRMNEIVNALTPDSLLLFNESFAATNEREGSEIARQIVRALLRKRMKIFFVTHFFELAHGFWREGTETSLFLRAERRADGQRTFKLLPGEPLQTSFGVDLYKKVFGISKAADPAREKVLSQTTSHP